MDVVEAATPPPLRMVSVPLPEAPTARAPLLVQVEPAPSTVTAPIEPEALPTKPAPLLTAPPLRMVSVPVPEAPTWRSPLLAQVEPTPSTVTAPIEPTSWPT